MALTDPTHGPQMSSSSPHAGPSSSAAIFKRLHPAQYISRFLAKGYRSDGRKIHAWRDASINVGSISTANGSALVRVGETTIVCGIKAEIAEPDLATPTSGFVVPNIDLPALCSPKFKPGPPSDEAQTLSTWLNELIVSSKVLPPKKLCICPGKAVWAIYVDVVCINYDGNAFDAAALAVMAALRNTRLPKAVYDEETGRTTCSRTQVYPLPLGRIPLACSFGIFESSHLLPDPTSFEAPLLSTNMVIALDETDRACMLRHEGLGGLAGLSGQELIRQAWELARARVRELRQLLDEQDIEM